MRYKIAISCEKQVRVFNVESELTLQQVFNLVTAFVKKGYQVTVTNRFKKHKKLISLEELINAVSELRFYKYVTKEVTRRHLEFQFHCSIEFPMDIKLEKQWSHDTYGPITFFKLNVCGNSELLSIDYEALQKRFADKGLDLCKSKTEGIWYTHNLLRLLDVCNELIIEKVVEKKDTTSLVEKVEL